MKQISNRFFVTALDDGTTLHGGLATTKPLIQAWDGSAPNPNWTDTNQQPIIYLTIYNGATPESWDEDNNTIHWFYDNKEITFNSSSGKSTNTNPTELFEKIDHTYQINGVSYTTRALRIRKNIVSSNQTAASTMTIRATGTIRAGNANLPFEASTQMRTTSITGTNGYFGLIYYEGDKSVFTEKGESIYLYGKLYSGGNEKLTSDYVVKWYINDTEVTDNSLLSVTTNGSYPRLKLIEGDVTDNAIIKAEFKPSAESATVYYTDYVSIDDLTDPEYMYIQYNNQNGNSASLRKGDTVDFRIWVGTLDSSNIDTRFTNFYVRILDATGAQYNTNRDGSTIPSTSTTSGTKNALGYRALIKDGNKAALTIGYDDVVECGGNMTGYVLAETNN